MYKWLVALGLHLLASLLGVGMVFACVLRGFSMVPAFGLYFGLVCCLLLFYLAWYVFSFLCRLVFARCLLGFWFDACMTFAWHGYSACLPFRLVLICWLLAILLGFRIALAFCSALCWSSICYLFCLMLAGFVDGCGMMIARFSACFLHCACMFAWFW